MEIKKKINYLRQNKLSVLYKILQTFGFFIIFFATNNVFVFQSHNIFGIPLLFGFMWCGYNPIWLGAIFATTYYLVDLSYVALKLGICVFIICVVMLLLNRIKKIRNHGVMPYLLTAIALVPYILENNGTIKDNVTLVISVIFCFMFLYIIQFFLKGTIKRGFSLRLNIDEKICGSLVLAMIAYGLAGVNLFNLDLATIGCVILVLLTSYTFQLVETVVIAFVYGLGVAIFHFNPMYISLYLCLAFFCYAFRSKTKIFSGLSLIALYLSFTLYFTEYFIFDLTTLIVITGVTIIYCFVPNRLINYCKDVFAGSKNKIAVRNMVKSNKDKICNKLLDMANVFKEMEYSFKRTLQKSLPVSEKKEMMKQDLASMVCRDCANKNKCLRINGENTTQVFDSLIDAGVSKGRVNDIDVNKYLLTRCSKLPILVTTANDIVHSYREASILSNNMDCSKILVAEQFAGVSAVMHGLITEISENISFDVELENRIIEDLLYKNIFCEEAVVYEKSIKERSVILLIKNGKIDKLAVEKIVSKVCKMPMKIVSIEPSELPDLSVVMMGATPNYDVVFGSATRNKAGVIVGGDTHSFIKVDNGKYMLALSDGMGSGATARETSDLAIGLIENYYKAGFDNDLILSSVNKLLSLNNEDNFSAIDICILDFFQNTMDFVKLGTPYSYIKSKAGVEEVKSSGLPMGILEEIRPHVTKKYINNFDIVILVSDGINDVFKNDELKRFINGINMINPQEIADHILAKAVSLSHGVCADDMTVIVARIFPTK